MLCVVERAVLSFFSIKAASLRSDAAMSGLMCSVSCCWAHEWRRRIARERDWGEEEGDLSESGGRGEAGD